MKKIFTLLLVISFLLPLATYAQTEGEGKKPSAIGSIEMPSEMKENLKKDPSDLKRPKPSQSGTPSSGAAKPGTNTKKGNTATQPGGKEQPKQQPKATLNGKPVDPKKAKGVKTVTNVQGYRIQVFSDGRNPATLQSRAKARGNMIVAKFPKYRGQVYTFSDAPNMYTRIGNFETEQAAKKALAELKRAFPSYASEMRVVKSQIKIVK